MDLHILNYNNYYNRIVKLDNDFSSFIIYSLYNVNFNPNDGVTTFHDIGGISSYDGTGNYAIVDDGKNVTRWFITEQRRTRGGMYRIHLRRDVIADFYDEIVNAPVYVERAMLRAGDNFIFNSEGNVYNQELKRQDLIQDETGLAWVVGYVPRNAFQEETGITARIFADDISADITVPSIEAWAMYRYTQAPYVTGDITRIGVNIDKTSHTGTVRYRQYFNAAGALAGGEELHPEASNGLLFNNAIQDTSPDALFSVLFGGIESKWPSIYNDGAMYLGFSRDRNIITSLEGATIRDNSTNVTYKIIVNTERVDMPRANISPVSSFALTILESLNNRWPRLGGYVPIFSGSPSAYTFNVDSVEIRDTIVLEQIYNEVETTISPNRYHLLDSPYDMFCIPYGVLTIKENGQSTYTSKNVAAEIAIAIGEQTGSGNIYDVQLLPFCPVRYAIDPAGGLDITGANASYVKDKDGNKISVVLWGLSSTFTFSKQYFITGGENALDVKVKSETEFCRLVSPNYDGIFQFSPVKNGGVTSLKINCSYKPFTPFIQVKPNFGRLYGINPEKDARGLICGGDFSLPQVTNAWANYELSNKNYLNIFNRQIENMEISNAIQREQQIWGAASGSVSGASAGAISGAMLGGVPGAIAGGIVGGAASVIGGVRDYQLSEQLRGEQISFATDMFRLNNQNIQALPNSLAKVGALNYANKIFPFLEYYSATEEEINALKDKIVYNSMTVGRIGYLRQYIGAERSYIKARLIRLEIADDSHIVSAIAEELMRGIYA